MTHRERDIDQAVREGLAKLRPELARQHAKFAKPRFTQTEFAREVLRRIERGRAVYPSLQKYIHQAWLDQIDFWRAA